MIRVKEWLNNQPEENIHICTIFEDSYEDSIDIAYNTKKEKLYANKIVIGKKEQAIYIIYNLFTNEEMTANTVNVFYNTDLFDAIQTTTVSITVNKIVHSVPNHQHRIFSLFEKYDTESYYKNRKGYYNPDRRQEIINEFYGIEEPEYCGFTNNPNDICDEMEEYGYRNTKEDYRYDAWPIDMLVMWNIAVAHNTRLHSIIGKF